MLRVLVSVLLALLVIVLGRAMVGRILWPSLSVLLYCSILRAFTVVRAVGVAGFAFLLAFLVLYFPLFLVVTPCMPAGRFLFQNSPHCRG
jgi:hypothetical protein